MNDVIKCEACNTLEKTQVVKENKGFCGVCKIYMANFAACIEQGKFELYWLEFIQIKKYRKLNNEKDKSSIYSFANRFVDQKLKAQLEKPLNAESIGLYILDHPESYSHKNIGSLSSDNQEIAYDLMNCKKVKPSWLCPNIIFECNFKMIPSIPILAAPFIILRKDVLKKVEHLFNNNIQIIPVIVEAKDSNSNDFVAINVLNSHNIWDLDLSTWKGLSKKDKDPMFMRNMVARTNLNISDHIFRNKQFSPHVIVSTELGQLLQKESPKTVRLTSINKWSN